MAVGRNAPCPCGSGKKYKKCCAAKEQLAKREAEVSLEQMPLPPEEATVYAVWSEWSTGIKKQAYAFLYELLSSQSEIRSGFNDSKQFELACKAGNIELPAGKNVRFKSLLIQENSEAYLLQTVGEEERMQPNIRCECIEFVRTGLGWRINAVTGQEISRSQLPELSFTAFRSGTLVS